MNQRLKLDIAFQYPDGQLISKEFVAWTRTLTSKIPYYVTIKGASAAVSSIERLKKSNLKVRCLQSIH